MEGPPGAAAAAGSAAAAAGDGGAAGGADGGADALAPTAGVNARALAELFRVKAEREAALGAGHGAAGGAPAWRIDVELRMVEIYNEGVRDLLRECARPAPPGADGGAGAAAAFELVTPCLLYTSPSPRDRG